METPPSQQRKPLFNNPQSSQQQQQRWKTMTRHELPHATLTEKEQWIQMRLSSIKQPSDFAAQVTRDDFCLLLQDLAAQAKSLPGCAVRAERWLGRLERLAESVKQQENNNHDDENDALYQALLPDATCYRHVIQAWADSTTEDPNIIVARARRWLLKHANDWSHEWQRPDTASYNAFLDAASKGRALKGVKKNTTINEHAELAQSTLEEMVEDRKIYHSASRIAPNIDSFNYVMRAWTRCRRSPEIADRTMAMLRFLEDYGRAWDDSVKPNTKSYGMVLDSLSCLASQKVRRCLDPKNPMLNGLDEVEMMERVIQVMQKVGGDLVPTVFIYNNLITAWSHLSQLHSDKATAAAERIMQQMTRYADQGLEEMRPDAKTYLLVIRVWKNTRLSHRANRAAWWLDSQWRAYAFDGKGRPTTEGYNMVIRMFAETGQPERAEEYFNSMNQKDRTVLPNSETFVYIVKCWVSDAEKNADIRSLQRATSFLYQAASLEEQDETNLVRTAPDMYLSILTASRTCARLFPTESLALALEVFGKMQQSHHVVGPLEYTRLLQVGLVSLSVPEKNVARTKFIRRLVEDCAEAGLVSGPFVRSISDGPIYRNGWTIEESDRMMSELFADWPFPPSWTRNIRDEGYFPQRTDLIRMKYHGKTSHGKKPYTSDAAH